MNLRAIQTLRTYAGIIFVAAGIALVFASVYLQSRAAPEAPESTAEASYAIRATTTIPLSVSGLVEAADMVTVRAEASGPVERVFVREGSVVAPGTLLSTVAAPVLAAQLSLQEEAGALSVLAQEANEVAQKDALSANTISAGDAAVQRDLQHKSDSERVDEAVAALLTTLDGSVLSLASTLDFVDSNRSLFPRESLAMQRDIVKELYGSDTTFLGTTLRTSGLGYEGIRSALSRMEQESAPDPEALLALSERVNEQFDRLAALLTEAESRFFDERRVQSTQVTYSTYLTQRTNTTDAQARLLEVHAALQTTLDSARMVGEGKDTGLALAETQRSAATAQAQYAASITNKERAVQAAQGDVLRAQYTLTRSVAPFAGVISSVFIEDGEYVAPGTPLFALTGAGAREVHVSVPLSFLPLLKEGQVFMVGEDVAGHVDRFAPTATRGSVEVVVSLTAADVIVGDVIRGTLLIEGVGSGIVAVPRTYVSFASDGPRVTYESGDTASFTVLHDAGELLFGTLAPVRDELLVPAVSTRLR